MDAKLLTIVIPTYNRADCLSLLFETLARQLAGLEHLVDVVVGDNASTDRTPTVIDAFRMTCPTVMVLRHPENLGPEENFCRCIDRVRTRFFWLIGDDDLPRATAVRRVVQVLAEEDPDLLYLNSRWMPNISSASDSAQLGDLSLAKISRQDFARHVNIWVTFISGMVVNKQRLMRLNPGLSIRRFAGTSLVQLGWILPLLMAGDRFIFVAQRCLLATSGNTGGYRLLAVFATNFPDILDKVCGPASSERRSIFRVLAWTYVPGLLWMARFGKSSNFLDEDVWKSLEPLRGSLAYWLLILPLAILPRTLALPFWILSRLLGKVIRVLSLWRFIFLGKLGNFRLRAGR